MLKPTFLQPRQFAAYLRHTTRSDSASSACAALARSRVCRVRRAGRVAGEECRQGVVLIKTEDNGQK